MANKKRVVFRDSITGNFVSEEYANAHKATTEREHVDPPKPKPRGGGKGKRK